MLPGFLMGEADNLLTTADIPPEERFSYWNDWVLGEFGGLDCKPVCRQSFSGSLTGRQVGDFSVNEARSDRLFIDRSLRQIRKSSLDDLKLIIPLSGEPTVQQGLNCSTMKSGDLVLFDSRDPYSLQFTDNYHALIMQLPRRLLSESMIPHSIFGQVISAKQGLGLLASHQVIGLYGQLENMDLASQVFAVENLISLLRQALSIETDDVCAERDAVDSALLSRAKKFIERNLENQRLAPHTAATAVGISTRYLHRLFEPTGVTFSRYVMNRRLERAERLLSDPSRNEFSVTQVALMCGLNDSSHFSRVFKKQFGQSPREYRRLGTR